MNDEENYYILDFEGDKGIARLEITTPHFAPYYYACFNILRLMMMKLIGGLMKKIALLQIY